jgi:hypothetical protein
MKIFQIRWALLIVAVALLAACSRSGSSASDSVMTVKSTDQSGTQTEYTARSSSAITQGNTISNENKTILQICGDVDKDEDCSQMMVMTIDGTTPGQYTIDSIDASSQIIYHDELKNYVSTSGDIFVTSLGNAGGAAQGRFNAVLECSSGCTGTVNMTGSFNVVLNP